MQHHSVDVAKSDRGVLFDPDAEMATSGWTTGDPYPKILKLMEGPAVQAGSLEELMGLPQQYSKFWPTRPAYTVLSFDAVNKAFMDGDAFSNKVYDDLTKTRLGDTLLNLDGDAHERMRNVTKPFFKPSFTQGWWNDNWIVRAVDDLFNQITAKDYADLNLELCAPLPMSVISIGFGLPSGEALSLRKAMHDIMAHVSAESVAAGNAEVERIVLETVRERMVNPRDDLISKIAQADYEDENGKVRKLTDVEILRYCLLIVFAGGGTTWRQLGITIMALLNNRDQFEALRADRSLLRQTIQESTRWYPTDPVFLRWVAKDTELAGVKMKAGSIAYLCVAAANRDRTQWDDPDIFNIRRPIKRHFAFGAGAHACLGQHLSRQEMEVALNAMLDRLGDLRWDAAKPAPRMSGGTLVGRGPDALHVRFTPR